MKHEDTIKRLDQEIRILRIESERFFSGDLRQPPERARDDLQNSIRTLHNASQSPNFAERFRISALEAKFNSFNELYMRRMRKHEYGDMILKSPGSSTSKPRPPRQEGKALGSNGSNGSADSASRVQISKVLNTQEPSLDTLRALYGEIQNATPSRPLPDFQKFSQTLSSQLGKLHTTTGCREVQIKCTPNGGKLKLVVKPVKPVATSSAQTAAQTVDQSKTVTSDQ
jgi:hypothetical protein